MLARTLLVLTIKFFIMKNYILLIAAFVSMSFGAFAASDVTTKIKTTSPYGRDVWPIYWIATSVGY